MEKKKEQVLDFLEKMEIEAQSLVNRGVRYYAKPATEMLPFVQLALEVVRELWSMYELWAKCPVDVEAITFFAEKIKSHYPHTKSICSTIDKELAAFRETRVPAIALEQAKDNLIQWLVDDDCTNICRKCSKKKEWDALWVKNHSADCPYFEKRECAKYMIEYFLQKVQQKSVAEDPQEEPDEQFEDPDAHTCDYSARGECKICGEIRYKSPLWFEIYGGEP